MSVFVPTFRHRETNATPEKAVVKAGPLGPGAGPLLTEFPLAGILGRRDVRKRIRDYWQMGITVPWIRAAERVITDRASTMPWHLEDENDEEITDDTADPDSLRVLRLLEKPQANLPSDVGQKLTGREMRALTYRHMGLCGTAFWYLDELDGLGIPNAILYIRPDRMYPAEDERGNLTGWRLDADSQGKGGMLLPLASVLRFVLQPPDEGHYGTGLVESAMMKAQLTMGTDAYAASVLQAGGRLQGILSPKTGAIDDDNVFRQLEYDARTIVEQPNAAARTQIVRAPIDFTSTAMTMEAAKIIDMMAKTRDDLLSLWGVPPSQIGITMSRGLNSGESQNYEEAALIQNAVHPRLLAFSEVIQYHFLDPMAPATVLEYEVEEPSFDDQAPLFELLAKSSGAPLRNRERREIIGLDPFGPEVMGTMGVPLDDEVWMPMTVVGAFAAPTDPTGTFAPSAPAAPEADVAPEAAAAGETTQGPLPGGPQTKASLSGFRDSLMKLRASIDRNFTPRMRTAVADLLAEQKREVAEKVRANAAHVRAKPRDTAVWWDARKWDKRMKEVLGANMVGIATTVSSHISEALPPMKAAPPGAVQHVLNKGAGRVTGINDTTRDAIVIALLAYFDDEDATLDDIIASIEGHAIFDEYRSELIARTETMFAYNAAALGSYTDAGVTMVEAIDGDEDEECATRVANNPYSIEDADGEEDHPNGTLDWVPIVESMPDEVVVEEKARTMKTQMSYRAPEIVINVAPSPAPDVTVNVPRQPAPIVNVAPAEVHVPPAVVNVEAQKAAMQMPDIHVHVPEQPAPVVNVNIPPDGPKRVVRDNRTGDVIGIEPA